MEKREDILQILNTAFLWKYNSLAAYILQARPYVEEGDKALLESIEKIAEEDKSLSEQLAQTIESLDGIPRIAPFEPFVSDLNYLYLSFLAGLLTEKLEEQAKTLANWLSELSGSPKAQEALSKLESSIRAQIRELRTLTK